MRPIEEPIEEEIEEPVGAPEAPVEGEEEVVEGGEEDDPAAFAEEEGGGEGEEASNVSPEEQAEYRRFVGRGMELIYSDQMFDKVVDMLDGDGQDPRIGLAMTTAMIVTRVARAADESGARLSPDVLKAAGEELFEQLAEISDEAKISDYANDSDAREGAYFKAIDLVVEQLAQSGELDQEAAKQAMQQLSEMDKNGELEATMTALAKKGRPKSVPKEMAPKPPMQRGGMGPLEGGM